MFCTLEDTFINCRIQYLFSSLGLTLHLGTSHAIGPSQKELVVRMVDNSIGWINH